MLYSKMSVNNIVLLLVLCSKLVNSASTNITLNCDQVKPFFVTRNISFDEEPDKNGSLCGGNCCSTSVEMALRLQVQRDFSNLLSHNSRSLQGLLDTTSSTVEEHVTSLTRQSQNKTLSLFTQVYREMATLYHQPINDLYSDIRRYIQLNESTDVFVTSQIDIKTSVLKFFTDIFPLVYHRNINTVVNKDFTIPYKACLKQTINEVIPFGDIPKQIFQSLHKSLEATRLLLQSFSVGEEVLNTTETLLTEENNENECHEALVKLVYCPKCLGLKDGVKPCSGYCLNVLRGCLTKHVAELDAPWNGYVEAMERLVVAWKQHNNEIGVNVDAVIRTLDTRISEAIMYAMENSHELDKRVKKACGQPKLTEKTGKKTIVDATVVTSSVKKMRDSPLPETQLLHFLTSVAKSRGFYTNLADNLCHDDSFAESMDDNCWNGQRIGEYSKTVVGPGVAMQKYNPELQINTDVQNVDPKIAHLADKLRHVHSLVITALGTMNFPESDSFMQGDAAELSGSGDPRVENDSDDDGEGSGTEIPPPIDSDRPRVNKDGTTINIGDGKVSGATSIYKSTVISTLSLLILFHIHRCFG